MLRTPVLATLLLLVAAGTADVVAKCDLLVGGTGGTHGGTLYFHSGDGGRLDRITFNIFLGPAAVKGTSADHGLHIHSVGATTNGCADAQGHWDPTATGTHGLPGTVNRHYGDLGNIWLDYQGRGESDLYLDPRGFPTFEASSIIGLAMVLHADPDYGTNAPNARIACCVITGADSSSDKSLLLLLLLLLLMPLILCSCLLLLCLLRRKKTAPGVKFASGDSGHTASIASVGPPSPTCHPPPPPTILTQPQGL